MENYIKQLINTKQNDLEIIKDLVINTVKAKALYRQGGWTLVNKELGNSYMNPNFSIHYGNIHGLLKELGIKVDLSIKNNMSQIESLVNNQLGVKAVEYQIDRLAHKLVIVI